MMLVPAMAFAWCVVSMSAPAPHAETLSLSSTARTRPPVQASAQASTESVASAEADPETQQQNRDDPAAAQQLTDTEPPVGPAEGRRVPVKLVTPAIVRAARTFLDLPMGAERSVDVEGRRYVFVLERHYHPPGFVGGPIGYHKGVTVYEFR